MNQKDRIYRLRADVRFRNVGGEGVVLCQDRGEVLVVNGLGVRIVEMIKKGESLPLIVTSLLEEYDVEEERLTSDVSEYIAELEGAGVLDEDPGP